MIQKTLPQFVDAKKRSRHQHRREGGDSDSHSDSSSESSTGSSKLKPQRQPRRRGGNKGSNKKKRVAPVQQPETTMTKEEMSRYVAMDCEMVGVGFGGQKSAVARVTLIDWHGSIVLDEFVRPDRDVTDYRTFVSGITPENLENATLDLDQCREKVAKAIHDKILVGHALKNDLHALGISHPWYKTRDTGKFEPFMKTRPGFDDGVLWPRKLKELVKEKLKRDIQVVGQPHSAFEDALAALDLYRLVRRKWEKVMDYKINRTREIEGQRQQQPAQ